VWTYVCEHDAPHAEPGAADIAGVCVDGVLPAELDAVRLIAFEVRRHLHELRETVSGCRARGLAHLDCVVGNDAVVLVSE
jgi:hypothetical protein